MNRSLERFLTTHTGNLPRVGRKQVIAGTDCGSGTRVGQAAVDPDVAWAKLASLAERVRP